MIEKYQFIHTVCIFIIALCTVIGGIATLGLNYYGKKITEIKGKEQKVSNDSVNTKMIDHVSTSTEKIAEEVRNLPKKLPRKVNVGDTYNATSHNQTGGVTAARIDKVVIANEEEIDPASNYLIVSNADNTIFRLKPKVGKWIQPYFFVRFEDKDLYPFKVSSQSGRNYDTTSGYTLTFEDGSRWYGTVFGLNSGAVENPATKDFYYEMTFQKSPKLFAFGDMSTHGIIIFTPTPK